MDPVHAMLSPYSTTTGSLSAGPVPEAPGRPVRDRLLNLVRAKPGINKSAVRKELGVAWGTVSYHVKRLGSEGLLQSEAAGRDLMLFPAGTSPGLRRSATALRCDDARRALQVLTSRRQTSLGELAEELAVSRKVARRLVRMLLAAGLVENLGASRPRYVRVQHEPLPLVMARTYGSRTGFSGHHAAGPQAVEVK